MKIGNLVLIMLCMTTPLTAAPGCMSQSEKLQRYDNKDYHYVRCNCPCAQRYKMLADRGMCTRCFHFRDPQPEIIINARDVEVVDMVTTDTGKTPTGPQNIIARALAEQTLSF